MLCSFLIAADRCLIVTLGSVFPNNCQSPVSELSPYNTCEDNSLSWTHYPLSLWNRLKVSSLSKWMLKGINYFADHDIYCDLDLMIALIATLDCRDQSWIKQAQHTDWAAFIVLYPENGGSCGKDCKPARRAWPTLETTQHCSGGHCGWSPHQRIQFNSWKRRSITQAKPELL